MTRIFTACLLLSLLASCSTHRDDAAERELRESRWSSVRSAVALRSARTRIAEGDYAAAKRELDTALALGADTPRLRLMMAQLAIEHGRYREARAHLDRTEALRPGLAEAAMVRALLAEVQGRWSEAAGAYRLAAERAPTNDEARLAEVHALRAADREGEAELALAEHLRARPESSVLLAAAAEQALHRGESQRAVEYLDRSAQVAPPGPDVSLARGLAMHRAGQHAEAVAALEPHVGSNATKELHLALARSALALDRFDLSIRTLQQLVHAQADDAEGWYELAAAYFLTDRPELTLESLRHALALRPRYREAVELLGHLRLQAGQLNHALAAYHLALDLGASPEALAPVMQIARAGRAERSEERRLPVARPAHMAQRGPQGAVPAPPPPPPMAPGS